MNTQQLQTLKAYIESEPALAAKPMTMDGAYEIAEVINQVTTPDYIVWKTKVTWDEIMENGMDFTRVDNLTNGSKWRIWEWLFKNSNNSMNPSKTNHRAGIDASWVGTAQDLAVRASIYVHCKRKATTFEKVLATGSGTDASPSTMGLEGPVSYQDVHAARIS